MTTITSKFTKECLIDWAVVAVAERGRDLKDAPESVEAAANLKLAEIALAALTAEPVRYLNKFSGTCVTLEQQSNAADDVAVYIPLYTAPPAPVVPDEMATSDDMNLYQKSFAQGYNACRTAMLQGVEPVSQTYKLPELIEGMEVSIDVSTCDADAGNRYFGTVTEVSELDTAKNGYILLVQDAKPNFDVNGNSPVSPGGWISCSDRMPEDEQEVIVHNKLGYRYVSYFDEHSGLFFDMRGGNQMNCIEHILVTHWRPMPAAPKPEQS